MSDIQLNGMQLPTGLITALKDGTWLATGKRWTEVFPVDEIGVPKLYSADLMRQVNDKWKHEIEAAFIGIADGKTIPGAMNPARSLLIGELQSDTMIALDYRNEGQFPSVAFLNVEGRWAMVAETFDSFWKRLVGGP